VPFGYGTIWLLITEWIGQHGNQSHARKAEKKSQVKIENLSAE
jgi:hypothetical protein